MQYLGKFFSSAKQMYSDINKATLSGAIDVIVVKYPNGELVSSPFYVQFGKTGILRPCEDEVEVSVNGRLREDLRMHVNKFGQAYFIDTNHADDAVYLPNADSGVLSDVQSRQNLSSPDSYDPSPPMISSTNVNLHDEETFKDSDSSSSYIWTQEQLRDDLLDTIPELLKNLDLDEFKSYMLWLDQDRSSALHRGEIHFYKLTDEQNEAVTGHSSELNDDNIWVYWGDKWFSWRTATIKLRFLCNLRIAVPQALESKLMEVDRKNPAFVLLPESLQMSENSDGGGGGTQFEFEQADHLDQHPKSPVSLQPFKLLNDNNDHPPPVQKSFGTAYPESFPGSPIQSRKSNENGYFSDGYSPNDKHDNQQRSGLNWGLSCEWVNAYSNRAFNLTPDHLKQLNLNDGINEAAFTTITKYQGTCTCYCLIYVWNSTDKIVISDIDGTITKSDLLGHVLHWVGYEWTHDGVIQLYKRISENGFRLMYLSARAIGQANLTRKFLEQLVQGNETLPAGPIILSPNSVITSLQVEVIQKRPQELKIANLKPLGELFRRQNPDASCPFFAGFGNRLSDVETYRAIGIPDSRIFIVNPEGVMETASGIKLSLGYRDLYGLVDTVFPVEKTKMSGSIEYSDFSFWRDTLPSD